MINTDALVKQYGGLVSSICHRMIQDRDIAEDAAQQVWLEVIKSLPGFRGEASLSTWIYTIARRVVMHVAITERQYTTQFLRGYFRSGERELGQTDNFDKEVWVREMCDQCLTGILHCLDNESRLVYLFRDVVMLDYAEIAGIMEKDESSLRQIVSRTRRKLKNFLNNECVLFNPQGSCQCRMQKFVQAVNLPQEYARLRTLSHTVSLYRDSQKMLPAKNYWEKQLG